MITEEIQITEYNQMPSIPGYKFFAALGSTRSMGIAVYFKEQWKFECKELEHDVD